MATTKTYVISPGGNTIVTGQQLVLDGVAQTHTDGSAKLVPTGKHKTIIINSASTDSWASGDDFEINNLATNNTLNATLGFNFFSPHEINPAAFSGIQLVNITLGEFDTTVDGGGGSNGLPLFSGIQTLTLKSSAGGFLTFGTQSAPLTVPLSNIVAQNATQEGSGIEVNIAASVFNAATPVNFSFSGVGSAGTHASVSDDYVHGSNDVFSAGFAGGGTTANTWNLKVTGNNFVELFTHGATNTSAVNISGGGNLTLFGVSFEFANVATINDTATGAQVITGGLQTNGAFKDYTGFLTDNTALTSLTVTSTNSGNFIDLSSFESIAGITISVAAGTVVLDDEVLFGSSPIVLGTPTNIGYGEVDGSNPGNNGTINWANLPSSANKLTFYSDVNSVPGDTFAVINAPTNFTMNLQDENFNHNNFVVTAANTTSLTNTLTLDLGNAVTGGVPNDINENWAINNYNKVNIVLAGSSDVHLASEGGFFVTTNGGGAAITISGALVDPSDGDVFEMHFGNISDANIFDYLDFGSLPVLQGNGVLTGGGSIVDTAKAFLELGITDAVSIDATTGHGLFMEDPTSDPFSTLTVHGSTGIFNNLQGSFGDNSFGVSAFFTFNTEGGFFGLAGKANITGGSHGDDIWDTGGTENITLATTLATGHSDTINYSQFELNGSNDFGTEQTFAFAINDDHGGYVNNFNGTKALGPGVATVTNYNASVDHITFNDDSWGAGSGADFGPGTYEGLVDTQGNHPEFSGVNFQVVLPSGTLPATNGSGNAINLVVFDPSTVFTAGTLQAAINDGGGFTTTGNFVVGDTYSMIFAYNNGNGTELADVQFDKLGSGAFHVDNVQNLMNVVGVGPNAVAHSVEFVT
jgi:hypothetical protein